MDKMVVTSILEYLLFRPGFPSSILRQFIKSSKVTFDHDNLRIKIGLALMSINDQVSCGYVSGILLTSLETLEKMFRMHKVPILDSMKSAFGAIVLGCLWGILDDGNYTKFCRAVRILGFLFSNVGESELVTDELRGHRDNLGALLLNRYDLENWKDSNTKRKENALTLTRAFVCEAMTFMRPSRLERVFMADLLEETVSDSDAVENESIETELEFLEGVEMERKDEWQLVEEDKMDLKRMRPGTDGEDEHMEGYRPGEAEAVDVAGTSDPKGEETEREMFAIQKRSKRVLGIDSDDLLDSDSMRGTEVMRKSSNIEQVSPQIPNSGKLPDESPVKFTKRRIVRKWTQEEEIAVEKGVEKYGKGHWKQIWADYQEIFDRRTPVNLKDKWRTIENRRNQRNLRMKKVKNISNDIMSTPCK